MEVMPRSAPIYRVFRDQHGIPQFDPKRGTQALKDALIYAFPTLETELQLMQAALKRFFDSESGTDFICELPENNLQVSLAKTKEPEVLTPQATLRSWKGPLGHRKSSRATSRSRTSSIASTRGSSRASSRLSSRPQTPIQFQEPLVGIAGEGFMTTWNLSSGLEIEKRKRQPYDAIKRRKVAENRGNACERHRAHKTTCDPNKCPDNKLHLKLANDNLKTGDMAQIRSPPVGTPLSSTPEHEVARMCEPSTSDAEMDSMHIDSMSVDDSSYSVQSPTALHPQTAQSSFPLLSNHSQLTGWSGNPHGGPSPWNSYGSATSTQEPILESDEFKPVFKLEQPMLHNNQSLETPRDATRVPVGYPQQSQIWPTAPQMDNSIDCMEDPFMGWETKRASYNLDDYGWVLSHVETL